MLTRRERKNLVCVHLYLTVLEEHMRSVRGMLETLITHLSYINVCECDDLIPCAYEAVFTIPILMWKYIDIGMYNRVMRSL